MFHSSGGLFSPCFHSQVSYQLSSLVLFHVLLFQIDPFGYTWDLFLIFHVCLEFVTGLVLNLFRISFGISPDVFRNGFEVASNQRDGIGAFDFSLGFVRP